MSLQLGVHDKYILNLSNVCNCVEFYNLKSKAKIGFNKSFSF